MFRSESIKQCGLGLMKTNLRILLLEDSHLDAELIERELTRDGFSFSLARIETEVELRRELDTTPPDLVLSDHGLPTFDGFKALEIVRKLRPQLPFIFVSGSNDQQMVFDMYEQGATDYVYKRDLKDLEVAVHAALEMPPAAQPAATPASELVPAVSIFPSGHLSLCPLCHRARDEAGRIVQMQDYCDHCVESVVVRQVCADCERLACQY
jgi:DNA-binding response OmpR family regulator